MTPTLVPVAASELFEWAWLAAELADWLDHAAEATRTDYVHHFANLRHPNQTAAFLVQISERIGARSTWTEDGHDCTTRSTSEKSDNTIN